jgi:hypothetical protein
MRNLVAAAIIAAMAVLGGFPAFADDWRVTKLRGAALELVDGAWQRLARGDVVPDDRVIRTIGGRITLVRGGETIELGPNTQIQIFDKESRRPFTTVKQYFGTVAVEAEVREVQHFAVQTPYLVAVVKGTRFVVVSDKSASKVSVRRGAVAVTGTGSDTHTLVVAGQAAGVTGNAPLQVSGRGRLPEVVGGTGKPVGVDASVQGRGGGFGGNGITGNGNGVEVDVGVGSGNGNGDGLGASVDVGGGGVGVSAGVGGTGVSVGLGGGGISIGLGN